MKYNLHSLVLVGIVFNVVKCRELPYSKKWQKIGKLRIAGDGDKPTHFQTGGFKKY